MNERIKKVLQIYQKGHLLNLENLSYKNRIINFFSSALMFDMGKQDLTSNMVIDKSIKIEAEIISKEDGVVAGLKEIQFYYQLQGIFAEILAEDGKEIFAGQKLIKLKGNAQKILSLERVALNILRKMSGVATITKDFTKILNNYSSQIAATRKTTMDEYLEKSAVFSAKALTHRLGLDDFVLIKDCHLDILRKTKVSNPIEFALKKCIGKDCPIEIEVENEKDAYEAAKTFKIFFDAKLCVIMLDNMSPEKIKDTLNFLKAKNLYEGIIFEGSGGINLKTLENYAQTNIDVLSTSQLTENSKKLDIHQKIVR